MAMQAPVGEYRSGPGGRDGDLTAGATRTRILTIPAPAPWLTANAKRHLTKWTVAEYTKAWRGAGWAAAKQARLPVGLARVRIDALLRFPAVRNHDEANLMEAVKAAVDGLGPPYLRRGKQPASAPGYGLIPDDSRAHLDGPHVAEGKPSSRGPWGELVLHITDLSDLAAGRTWTPPMPSAGGERRTVKRACNGCSGLVGDVRMEEIECAMEGRTLPDVRHECPICRTKPEENP